MSKMIFTDIKGRLIFTIELDLTKKFILGINIEEDTKRAASLCYPRIKEASYDSLETLMNHYCDTENIPLEKLIEHIKEKGFYTPYKPNLKIKIE